jgi:hypothetical protein
MDESTRSNSHLEQILTNRTIKSMYRVPDPPPLPAVKEAIFSVGIKRIGFKKIIPFFRGYKEPS